MVPVELVLQGSFQDGQKSSWLGEWNPTESGLSACSHNGVLNILQSCANFTSCNNVYAFVGGMHLVDGISEEQDDVESIADEIKNIYPDMKIYTGHCTGENAISVLSRKMKDRFCVFNSGMEIPI